MVLPQDLTIRMAAISLETSYNGSLVVVSQPVLITG
jgi:hypothetical protein